jgi:integrase/recombinase XerD
MRKLKVRLYIRVRLRGGDYAFLDPAWNKNHTLRAGYALVDGKAESHEEGIYYLRCLRDGKRVWQAVGPEADAAAAALQNKEHDLQSDSLGRSTPAPVPSSTPGPVQSPVPTPTTAVSLDDAIKSYMAEVRRFRAPKTIAAAQHMLALLFIDIAGRIERKAKTQPTCQSTSSRLRF